jgi:hypothetical protein
MEDNIFKINKSKIEDSASSEYKYYTIFGSHSSLDENGNPVIENKKNSFAYSRLLAGEQTFYLKIGMYGKIFNPMGLYSEGKQNKFLSKIGREEYTFKKVSQKVFDLYLNFLRTKNTAWLNNAERELS